MKHFDKGSTVRRAKHSTLEPDDFTVHAPTFERIEPRPDLDPLTGQPWGQIGPNGWITREVLTLPRKGTPAADLTDRERFALCVAAGARFENTGTGMRAEFRTIERCGIADRGDGGWFVAIGKEEGRTPG